MKVIVAFGTRPEAIKMCPLIMELKKKNNIECIVCLTGQHKEMLRQVMDAFGIQEDYNLDIMRDRQTVTSITTTILERLAPILQQENPDVVLVHGDTTTSFSVALASFYQKIPVGHVEAGLRTGNIYSPYPEEMNRLLTGRIATYHFAPTEKNKRNLKLENVSKNVYVTGEISNFKHYQQSGHMYFTLKDEKSQLKNKDKALKVLRARLYELECQKKQDAESEARRSQIGTGDRSEKIRTYNFPQGRVTDHRIKFTSHRLENIMNGDIDEIIDNCIAADQAAKLANMED